MSADSDEMKQGKKAGSVAAAALASKLRQERVRSMIVRPAKVAAPTWPGYLIAR